MPRIGKGRSPNQGGGRRMHAFGGVQRILPRGLRQEETSTRVSWWLDAPREDFTRQGQMAVRPDTVRYARGDA